MSTLERPLSAGTERLFNNYFLEKLTRSHISVPVTLFFIYAFVLFAINLINSTLSTATSIILFLLGWLTFSWVEYLVHRYVFHLPTTTKARKKFQHTLHGVHHHYPKDKDRLAMPPVLSIAIATVLLLLLRLIIGDLVFAFLPGFLVGYAFYLLIHYVVHIHKAPKNFFRYLWINHSIHHYKDGAIVFGVSSPLWDHIYRTMRRRELES